MKIQLRKLKSRLGEQRVIEKFLWLPVQIGDDIRWLERVRIVQEVIEVDVGGSMEWGNYAYKWLNVKFVGSVIGR